MFLPLFACLFHCLFVSLSVYLSVARISQKLTIDQGYGYIYYIYIALRSLDMRMTAIVPQAVVTDNRLGINSCHAISRLYRATLMSCATAKHVSIYIIQIFTNKLNSQKTMGMSVPLFIV